MYTIGMTEHKEGESTTATSMIEACSKGEATVVKELIEKGADVNLKDKVGKFQQSYKLHK